MILGHEIWKDIPNYEGIYQVSNLGKVKSLSREICNDRWCFISKEKILKDSANSRGYHQVVLYKNFKKKSIKVHVLVAICFLNHVPDGTQKLIVDHINNIKTDNTHYNLQIITQRLNSSKDKKNKTSKYTGVVLHKQTNKWVSVIRIDGKSTHLGLFANEIDAKLAYENKLLEIECNISTQS
jgi:hypothetical protein